jgi:hypothetical protein
LEFIFGHRDYKEDSEDARADDENSGLVELVVDYKLEVFIENNPFCRIPYSSNEAN